jgi:hypothetical protein
MAGWPAVLLAGRLRCVKKAFQKPARTTIEMTDAHAGRPAADRTLALDACCRLNLLRSSSLGLHFGVIGVVVLYGDDDHHQQQVQRQHEVERKNAGKHLNAGAVRTQLRAFVLNGAGKRLDLSRLLLFMG